MSEYVIRGARVLKGEVSISGAKNSVLPILASTVLNGGVSVLKNVPMLRDTKVCLDILRSIGAKVDIMGHTVIIDSTIIDNTKIEKELVEKMRSSIIFLGSILARAHQVEISYPGGCNLGKRPIDFHINALRELGADIEEDDIIKARIDKVLPAEVKLPFASVGATENIILASIFSDSKVIIKNCAKEPEIVDMVNFLIEMGANIEGAGTSTITIRGVKKLKKYVEYSIMPDRIEAGTFLCMGAITGGQVLLKGANIEHLSSVVDALKKTGCEFLINKDDILCMAPKKLKPISFLETKPYPYFPTDMQPQFMSLLCVADGTSKIKENIFEARNKHIEEFRKLGADIKEDETTFIINGKEKLNPDIVVAKELRGGASLITLALYIDGKTTIKGLSYIERGYENIHEKLEGLGADIKYIKS